jgi:probable HAF family extracellular repeat protein
VSDERAIRPHDDHALATTGQPSRWVARGLHHLDRPRRRLIDLGTLGGGSSRVHAINNRGQVVGGSETVEGEWHAFLWEDGRMKDLGTLGPPATTSSRAQGINNAGQVVG